MLITLEGIDNAGKTTIGKFICDVLNNIKKTPIQFEHEPTFSSETADNLNKSNMSDIQREFIFAKDRLNHQPKLNSCNTLCDSYIFRGLLYAKTFSSKTTYNIFKEIYKMDSCFKIPDATIIITTTNEMINKINKKHHKSNSHLSDEKIDRLQKNIYKILPFYKKLVPKTYIIENTYGEFNTCKDLCVNIVEQTIINNGGNV